MLGEITAVEVVIGVTALGAFFGVIFKGVRPLLKAQQVLLKVKDIECTVNDVVDKVNSLEERQKISEKDIESNRIEMRLLLKAQFANLSNNEKDRIRAYNELQEYLIKK